jgi:hypothetical protein
MPIEIAGEPQMLKRQLCMCGLIGSLAQAIPLASVADTGCDAINGTWAGSENPVGQRDAVIANYTIASAGSEVTVTTPHATAQGSCEIAADAYVLKLNWGEVTSEMTVRVVGNGVAMFSWQDSAGKGGRGSLVRESPAP